MEKYHKNPRKINNKQKNQLKKWLKEFGDLSGIVVNLPTNEIISGNQRSDVINLDKCEIQYTNQYDSPTKTGTMSEGYIIYNNEKLNYREVYWTPKQCEQANIIANKAGGNWDFDILGEHFNKDDLLEWGFDDEEFGFNNEDNFNEGVEINMDDIQEKMFIKLEYSFDEYQVIQNAIKENGNSPEQILWNALNLE